jgi:hypothetical protein
LALSAFLAGTAFATAEAPGPNSVPQSSPPGKISKQQAVNLVIEKLAKPSEAPRGLRVHLYPEILPQGSTIVPFQQWTEGKKAFATCERDSWFFWFDDDPLAQFAHPTRYVLVTTGGEIKVKEAEWWPVVNGKVVWGLTEERLSNRYLVFEKPPKLKIPVDWKHDFKKFLPQALPGCEAWVVLVCGSTDVGNTFDEDVRFLYNVFTGLGVNDNHIFYVSPWTTDPGVDVTTTIADVQWAINQVALNSDVEDKVFFFYSSHGGVDFLHCCPGSPGGGNVTSTDMDNWLDTINCRQLTILLQGCRTGSFIGYYSTGTVVAAENELTGDGERNRIAMTATDTDHSSYGGAATWGSTFTGGYVEAFNDPVADGDGNAAISVKEAYDYALAHDTAASAGWSFPHQDPTSLDPARVFHVCPQVDLWISDGPHDVGNNSYDYDSADIWSSLTPGGTTHEDPVSGVTNTVHVRVHNLGSAVASTIQVKLYWADTSTALVWPTSFSQIGTAATITSISPGGFSDLAWSWYVDPAFGLGHHFCFVATADNTEDPMTGALPGVTYVAPYDNNIAQKNITIVEGESGQSAPVHFTIQNIMKEPIPFDLIIRKEGAFEGRLILVLTEDIMKIVMGKRDMLQGFEIIETGAEKRPALLMTSGQEAMIRKISLPPMIPAKAMVEITPSGKAGATKDARIRIEEVVQGKVVGANTFLVRLVQPGDCPSTLRRALGVYAQLGHRFKSKAALNLVRIIQEAMASGLCQDARRLLDWKRKAFELEAAIGNELKGQVPKNLLDSYLAALKALRNALETRDATKVMIAQNKVLDEANKLMVKK